MIMEDLRFAVAGMAVLSSIALTVGLYVSARWPRNTVSACSFTAFAAVLLFVWRYHGTLQIARLLPHPSAIVLGNWIPLGAAFLAGIMLGQKEIPAWRRCSLASLILLASGYSVACCFMGLLPTNYPTMSQTPVRLQSRQSSCGACCAAMLLQHHGIEATEDELVQLCLTSYRGCPALGLYRGLKLKTAHTMWDVEVITCTADQLLQMSPPLLLRVELPTCPFVDAGGHARRSWRRTEHAVLLRKIDDAQHIWIVDPALADAEISWDIHRLREQWLGEALRLTQRSE